MMTTKIITGSNPAAPASSRASFHTIPRLCLATKTLPDHYEALELSVSASAADIKRYSNVSLFYVVKKKKKKLYFTYLFPRHVIRQMFLDFN